MYNLSVLALVMVASVVCCLPVERSQNVEVESQRHNIQKRFINPMFSLSASENDGLVKIRTKRSEEDCEKLQLCKLHAQSNRNFFAAFELYFVNKENARLWDHRAHSMAACEQRYGGHCYQY